MGDDRSHDYAEISSVQFLTLPIDLILDIILHLDVQDILVLQHVRVLSRFDSHPA
jgi:hypothetical protein